MTITADFPDFRPPVRSAAVLAGTAAALGGLALGVNAVAWRIERAHPPIGRFIEVDGVRLHYLERGAGRPVVLLHGAGSMLEDFVVSILDRLAERYRVIAFDRPGYGHSERPNDRVWTPLRQAKLLHAALARLGVEEPIVLGHSFGALVALAYGLAYPRETAGLVLVGGYFYPTFRLDFLLAASTGVPLLGRLLRNTVSPIISAIMLRKLIAKIFAPSPVPASFSRFPVSMMLRPGQLGAAGEESRIVHRSADHMSRHYGRLAVPTRILAGAGDEVVTTARQSVRLHHDVPGSRLRVVEGAGHMLHHVRPEIVADAVAQL
jgi:pimeloyl-ACP methyl ester carboxylesterase